MNIFDERIKKLQNRMEKEGLKAYIIPSTDPHMSEECCAYYAAERFYFCPFKGNDGTLLVTLDNYYIYTDGRYWTEAENELKGSSCTLVYQGKANVKSMAEFIKENSLYPLGLDTNLFSINELKSFYIDNEHKIRQASFRSMVKDLPALPKGKLFKIDDNLLSTTRKERVSSIYQAIKKETADAIVIPLLDDIAYVLGYRGSDIECTPVFYSYLYIGENESLHLFIDKEKLPEDFPSDINIHQYEEFAQFLNEHKNVKTVIDPNRTNAYIATHLKNKVYLSPSPVFEQKSIKGKVEIENTKRIQAIDGIAVLKLMKYIDDNISSNELNEYSLSQYLDNTRKERKECFDLSFTTIAAVDENAAMMHYAPSKEKNSKLTKNNQLILVDSGGQYYGGTTDTTRTFIVGCKVSDEVKHDYTLTLKSQIALTTTIFEKGCTGHSLDIKAREIMWKEGLDYKCGTGHGVGYISCVHEGPIGFRYYDRPSRLDSADLNIGHIITVEPGVYKPNKYGIRLENNLVVKEAFTTEQGIFYKFETITYCPYDRRGIDVKMLTNDELSWLNNYHKMVYETLSPLIDDKSLLKYLKEQCKEIKR